MRFLDFAEKNGMLFGSQYYIFSFGQIVMCLLQATATEDKISTHEKSLLKTILDVNNEFHRF